MSDIRNLDFSLGWQISEGPLKVANEETDKLKQKTKDVAKEMENTEKKSNKSFSSIGSSVKGAFSTIAGIGAGIAGGFGLFEFGEKAIDAGNNIYELSQKLNLSTQDAGQLNRILGLTNTSAQPFISTIERMDKSIELAGKNGNSTTKALEAFGLKLTDSNGKLLPINSQLDVMAQGFQKAQKAGLEDEYATSLFGAKAQQMIPLLQDYTDAKETASKVKGIGVDPKMAHEAEVNLKAMQMQFSQFGLVAGNALMPVIQAVLPELTNGFTKLAGFISSHQGDIKNVSNSLIQTGKGIAKDVTPILKDLFGFIENHGTATKNIILGIGTGMLAFDGIGKGIKVVNTFKDLHDQATKAKGIILGTKDSVGLMTKAIDGTKSVAKTAFSGVSSAAGMAGKAIGFMTSPVGLTILAIGALIAIGILLYKNWGTISKGIVSVWQNNVLPFFNGIGAWFSGIWSGVTGAFKSAWDGVSSWFTGLWNGIIATVKGAINTVIGSFNGIIGGINSVTGVVGKAIGINVTVPTIPKLARGTNNFQGGPAIINDGSGGGELAIMPNGSKVIPADKTDKILGNKSANHTFTANVNINMPAGASDSRGNINQLKATLEKLIPELMEEYFYDLSYQNPTVVER